MQLLRWSSRGQQEQGKQADTPFSVCVLPLETWGIFLNSVLRLGHLLLEQGSNQPFFTLDPSFGSQVAADPPGPQALA